MDSQTDRQTDKQTQTYCLNVNGGEHILEHGSHQFGQLVLRCKVVQYQLQYREESTCTATPNLITSKPKLSIHNETKNALVQHYERKKH